MSSAEGICENKESEDVKSKTESQNDDNSEITEVEGKIIKQIEYYFGDFNLSRDKFMKEQIQQDEGWIPLETLIKFNRLKAITTDFDQIVAALKKSPNNIIEVNDESSKIRRNPQKLTENGLYEEDKLKERCVYVKRFPDLITLDELQSFFKQFGSVENIQMRRFVQSKQFRGSVFVTFATKVDAEKFINLTSVKYENNILSRETKKEYEKRKNEEYAKKKEEKELKQKEKEAMQIEMEEEKNLKGCLLKLTGVTKELDWLKIKEFFKPFSSLAFVDMKEDSNEAILRFSNEGDAKVALEKAVATAEDNKLTINNVQVEGIVLEGEEEKKYWNLLRDFRNAKYKKKNQKGRKGKRGKQYDNIRKWADEVKKESAEIKKTCEEKNEESKNEENTQKHKLEEDGDNDKEESSPKKVKTEG